MSAPNSLITAAGVSIGTLLLGIPIAIATIASANVYVPDIVLGTKDIDAGPSRTKTLTFGLLTAPTDAVLSAAYISIIASVLCAIGIALIHFFHNSKKGVTFGWATLCLAATNLLGQLGCLAAWVVLQQKENARVPDTGAVQYVDGKYQTDGKMFTKEAWACTMEAYFSEKEDWANKACDDLVSLCRGWLKTGSLMLTEL
jgi:hypothetical protein